jgi:IS30 family transposase
MVCKWMAYNPLKLEERKKIKEAIDLNMSYSEMAEHVGRAKSVVMREAKRFGHYTLYDPEKAQQQFEKNASPPRKLKK